MENPPQYPPQPENPPAPSTPRFLVPTGGLAKNQFSLAVRVLKGISNPTHMHLRVGDEDARSAAIELITVLLVVIHGELGIDIPLRIHVLGPG